MDVKKLTICGCGALGTQVAYQAAFHHFDVTVYDLNQEILEKAKSKFIEFSDHFQEEFDASEEETNAALARMAYSTDLTEAVGNADLVIEAIPENIKIKEEFYKQLDKVAPPEKAIFVTSSSTLLPSRFAEHTGRPDKFLAMHMAKDIWKHKTAEVMGHAKTDPEAFDIVAAFAKEINMTVIPVKKEQPGFVLNSLLIF